MSCLHRLIAGSASILLALAPSPTLAQSDGAAIQQCVWSCLANTDGVSDPAYHACVEEHCAGKKSVVDLEGSEAAVPSEIPGDEVAGDVAEDTGGGAMTSDPGPDDTQSGMAPEDPVEGLTELPLFRLNDDESQIPESFAPSEPDGTAAIVAPGPEANPSDQAPGAESPFTDAAPGDDFEATDGLPGADTELADQALRGRAVFVAAPWYTQPLGRNGRSAVVGAPGDGLRIAYNCRRSGRSFLYFEGAALRPMPKNGGALALFVDRTRYPVVVAPLRGGFSLPVAPRGQLIRALRGGTTATLRVPGGPTLGTVTLTGSSRAIGSALSLCGL